MFSQVSEIVPLIFPYEEDSRGLGVSDMVDAIENNRKPRASKEMASHALEILEGIVKSSESGNFIKLESTFEIPELMPTNR